MKEKRPAKIKAAGDENDPWEARSLEELQDAGLEDAVDFAARELQNLELVGITENGREWTRLWYELSLARPTGADGPIDISETSAESLMSLAETNAHAFDLMMEVLRSRLTTGVSLPVSFGLLITECLEGSRKLKRPKQTDRSNPKVWARNFMLNYTAGLIMNFYDLKSERGKESQLIAASDVLFHALEKNGNPLNLGTIQNNLFLNEESEEKFAHLVGDIRSLILMSILDDLPD